MFFEDVNTLYEKYKYCSFWYELSYDDIVDNVDGMVDFIEITEVTNSYRAYLKNDFCYGYGYVDESSKPTKHSDGEQIYVLFSSEIITVMGYNLYPNQSLYFPIYIDNKYDVRIDIPNFAPLSSMNIIKCGSESDTIKVYLKEFSTPLSTMEVGTGKYVGDDWDTDLTTVNVLEDSKGKYVELTANRDGDEFTIISDGYSYFCGKILNYKSLPTITFNTLYRGNTQTIEVYFDGELIDSKYYDLLYQNQVLTNGKITISEDVTDLELEIYLKHPEYISTKLKYTLPVNYYTFTTQEELETGLSLGLTTLKINADLTLNNITLNNLTLIADDNVDLTLNSVECNNIIFKDINIIIGDSKCYFTNCRFDTINLTPTTNYTKTHLSNSVLNNCTVNSLFLVCQSNSELSENSLNESIIFSDDPITITSNTFTATNEVTSNPEYYPLMLYLTGSFDCKNNTFNQEKTYNDFEFNVALLKTITTTDIDEFIRLNNFNIDITVNSESYDGLFYSLIDDSKLHYKEIE
ncbi:MAG: hypothetical protein IKF11_10135 [Methanobrevibacter sp.]|nr:hypothetical protein [Methanobrevibacter sp.]